MPITNPLRRRTLINAALFLLSTGTAVQAQSVPEATLMTVIKSVRTEGPNTDAATMALMRSSGLSAQQRDVLADSLVSMVLDRGGTSATTTAKHNAILTLGLAGARFRLVETRYLGATTRLLHIFSASSDKSDLSAACFAASQLSDSGAVVTAMGQMARSRPEFAGLFLSCLDVSMGDHGGREALRTLYETDAITEPSARAQLEQGALKLGWKKRP